MPTTTSSTIISTTTAYEESVIAATVANIRYRANAYYDTMLSAAVQNEISDFLHTKDLENRKIRVLFVRELSTPMQIIPAGDVDLILSFGDNPKERTEKLLLLFIQKTPASKFRKFMETRNLPFISEICEAVCLSAPVRIVSYSSVGEWWREVKSLHDGIYLGQIPDAKTGSFVPNKPIGVYFSRTNTVLVTTPGTSNSYKKEWIWDPDYVPSRT